MLSFKNKSFTTCFLMFYCNYFKKASFFVDINFNKRRVAIKK